MANTGKFVAYYRVSTQRQGRSGLGLDAQKETVRNVHFVSNLMESGAEFVAVDFPQANKLTIHIIAAVAEHEAAMISQRTKDALAAAKKRGKVLGGFRNPWLQSTRN